MQELTVTSLDEAFINLEREAPMSVELEIKVEGRLDVDRLAKALRAAAVSHPLSRAKLAPATVASRRLTWLVPDSADYLAVEVTDEPAQRVRNRLQSVAPNLYRSPSFHVSVVREDDGDRLMLNLHHAAFDGMSGIRFLTSIAREYSGGPDPVGGPSLEEARDLRKLFGSRNFTDMLPRIKKVAGDVTKRLGITRLVRSGGDGEPGYLISRVKLTPEEVAAASARRPPGATINDLVIGALALTVVRWNRERGGGVETYVSVMMPVNMRPSEWSTEVVTNYASYLTIFVPTKVTGLTEAAAAVRDETGPVKRNGAAQWIVDVLEPGNLVPAVLKSGLTSLLPLVEKQFVETSTLSNLGRQAIPAFGDAGAVKELWFTPPLLGQAIPVAVGVAGLGRELYVGFRGGRSSMGEAELDEFAAIFRQILTSES